MAKVKFIRALLSTHPSVSLFCQVSTLYTPGCLPCCVVRLTVFERQLSSRVLRSAHGETVAQGSHCSAALMDGAQLEHLGLQKWSHSALARVLPVAAQRYQWPQVHLICIIKISSDGCSRCSVGEVWEAPAGEHRSQSCQGAGTGQGMRQTCFP